MADNDESLDDAGEKDIPLDRAELIEEEEKSKQSD